MFVEVKNIAGSLVLVNIATISNIRPYFDADVKNGSIVFYSYNDWHKFQTSYDEWIGIIDRTTNLMRNA